MARADWDIRGIKCCSYRDENGDTIKCDVYTYNEKFGKIKIIDIRELLNVSDQRFIDLLNEPYKLKDGSINKCHLITHFEEMFRCHNHDTSTYFNRQNIFGKKVNFDLLTLDLFDFEAWLDENYNLLLFNNINKNNEELLINNKGTIEKVIANDSQQCSGKSISAVKEAGRNTKNKDVSTRERKTLLKIIHAAINLRETSIDDRNLVSKLRNKVEELYKEGLSDDTVRNKINEIKELYKNSTN